MSSTKLLSIRSVECVVMEATSIDIEAISDRPRPNLPPLSMGSIFSSTLGALRTPMLYRWSDLVVDSFFELAEWTSLDYAFRRIDARIC